MWPFWPRTANSGPKPPSQADAPPSGAAESGEKLRRRAGCIWGFLTEPIALIVVTLLALVFGRAYLVGRARRLRAHAAEEEGPPDV